MSVFERYLTIWVALCIVAGEKVWSIRLIFIFWTMEAI